jgi:hypothetical protein
VTLPWIVALGAIVYLVLWQSGLLEQAGRKRAEGPPRRPRAKADPNRLKVFEDFLRDLKPEKDEPPGESPKD